MESLSGRTVLISGGSRGIGLAIAVRAARDGARVALIAKTAEPHPKLPGTIVVTRAALPHLRESSHAHVLTLSPPLSADPRWLGGHSAYTLSKMGMTMITLGLAADEAEAGIGANCLWPRTIIGTAAVQNLLGGDAAIRMARTPEIMGDAAHAILVRDPRSCTGNTFMNDEVLAEAGITHLDRYAAAEDTDLQLDIFVDGWPEGVPA